MAALDQAVCAEADIDQNITAERLGQRQAFAQLSGTGNLNAHGAARQAVENLLYQPQALLDLANPDPDAGVDVTLAEYRHFEPQLLVWRVAREPAGVERASRSAPAGSDARIASISLRLSLTSRILIQTRALTSPSVSTGTSNWSAS